MIENRENQQYFFTKECTSRLVGLNPDLCLCVPSVALELECLLLDIDSRFDNFPFFVYYDLNRGLHSKHRINTKKLSHLEYQFQTIVFDPPFSFVTPRTIAKNVDALLMWDTRSTVFVCYPSSGFNELEEAFAHYGLAGHDSGIQLVYENPPRKMGVGEKREIRLYRFERVL